MRDMLHPILSLASNGWYVFPLKPNGKTPIVADWENVATDNAGQIRAWWDRYPLANVAIACGPSHVLVIDLDRKHGHDGVKVFRELCAEHEINAPTAYVKTPTGGYHLYYQQPDGIELRNTAKKLGAGIDTRGAGGYVVCPPSVIGSRRYQWEAIRDIAPLPHALRWLLERDDKPKSGQAHNTAEIGHLGRYVRAALDNEAGNVARAAHGERNHTLYRAAIALGTLCGASWAGLDQTTVESVLTEAAIACGLDSDDGGMAGIANTIASGLKYGIKRPRLAPAGGAR